MTTAVLIGCRTRIRTLTNGVRDRCATVTQFGNAVFQLTNYSKAISENQYGKFTLLQILTEA